MCPSLLQLNKEIKKSIIGWTGHITRMEDMQTTFYLENLKGRGHFEDICVDGWIILKCV
jgi:hypothetical protein